MKEPVAPGQMLEPPQPMELGLPATERISTKTALEFAQKAFANSQELIRFMDQKASYALGATAALVAALALAINAVDVPADGLGFFLFVCGGTAAMALAVFVCKALLAALDVYRARTPEGTQPLPRSGLIFPLQIVELAGTDHKKYAAALEGSTESELVREYSSQVVILASIYKAKQDAVNRLVDTFHYVATAWLASVLFLASAAVLG